MLQYLEHRPSAGKSKKIEFLRVYLIAKRNRLGLNNWGRNVFVTPIYIVSMEYHIHLWKK